MNSRSTDVSTVEQERRRSILHVAGMLERESYPRSTLLGLVSLAGLSGFLASVGGLALGISSPAVRYASASLLGYLAFLLALKLWLRSRGGNGSSPTDVDLQPIGDLTTRKTVTFGGGGGFSGGGSSGPLNAATSVGDLAPAADAEGSLLGSCRGSPILTR
jgi:hypothetical protein